LLKAALQHHGRLSVTMAVMETGRSFSEVERVLNQMVESGFVFTRNHPETGVVEYVFKELL
jgi:predicted transcriptional regulator